VSPAFPALPSAASRRPRGAGAALFAAALALAGCGSTDPVDLVAACPPTEVALPGPTLGTAWVRLRMDARPLIEHGRESYLGESHVAEQQFKVPVPEALLTVLARDLRRAGLFSFASRRSLGQRFRVDFDILHAAATYTSGLQSVLPVLPSSLEAHLALRIVVTDEDGRLYLDEVFDERRGGSTSTFGGPREAAAGLLGAAARAAIDRAAVAARSSYDAFWARFPVESRPTPGGL
jgi:hypothetical protein